MNRKYTILVGVMNVSGVLAVFVGTLCIIFAVDSDLRILYFWRLGAGIGLISSAGWSFIFAAIIDCLSQIAWNTDSDFRPTPAKPAAFDPANPFAKVS